MKKIVFVLGTLCAGSLYSQQSEFNLDLSNNSWNSIIKSTSNTKVVAQNNVLKIESKKEGGNEIVINNVLKFEPVSNGDAADYSFTDFINITPLFSGPNDEITIEYLNSEKRVIERRILKSSDNYIYEDFVNSKGENVLVQGKKISEDGNNILERRMSCTTHPTAVVWEGRRCSYGVGIGIYDGVPILAVGARWFLFRRNAVFPIDNSTDDILVGSIKITSNVPYQINALKFYNNKTDNNPRLSMKLESNFHKMGSEDYVKIHSKANSFNTISNIKVLVGNQLVENLEIVNDQEIKFKLPVNINHGTFDVIVKYTEIIDGQLYDYDVVFGEGMSVYSGESNIEIVTKKFEPQNEGSTFDYQIVANGGNGVLRFSKIGGQLPKGLSISESGVILGEVSSVPNGMYVASIKVEDDQLEHVSELVFTVIENNKIKAIQVGSVIQNNSCTISPNPTASFIEVNNLDAINVKIYNSLGELVLSSSERKIDMSNFENGIYNLVILSKDGSYSVDKVFKI